MAATKILARHYRMDVGINYVLNGDKTDDKLLTAYQYCTPENAYERMKKTKEQFGKTDGVQCYHVIQSFRPGEITPELALEIAQAFAKEHLDGYEAVIGVHEDKEHIHAHIVFNSVSRETGEKYHSNTKSYYTQIRAISDRLCAEHGLSVIMRGERSRAVSYIEWLREQSGQHTFKSMLEADMSRAIEDANDYGHFLMLMEHMGYEVKHGNRLSFRLRGQEHWSVPGRRNALFTEDGIRAAIQGNLEAIEAGLRPAITPRRTYTPFRRHPKYTGFMALYVHYLYLLGKIEKQECPPRMTPRLKAELMRFDKYKSQFAFLREHGISTAEQMEAYKAGSEQRLAALLKQRTILNVQKKKQKPLYDALASAEALAPAKKLYVSGTEGIENEFAQYMDAVTILDKAGISIEKLSNEKAEVYEKIADINREIRTEKRNIALCDEITGTAPNMEKDIRSTETKIKEVERNDRRR